MEQAPAAEEWMDRPTIRKLATEAGVSVSTVNRILSGTDPVKASTI